MTTSLNYLINTANTPIVYAQITNYLFAQSGNYINDDIRQVSIAVVNNAGSTGILGMSNGSVFTIDKIN